MSHHPVAAPEDLAVGEPEDDEAGRLEGNGPGPVLLEARALAVGGVTVGLHDQPSFPPKEVHEEAGDLDVYLWPR